MAAPFRAALAFPAQKHDTNRNSNIDPPPEKRKVWKCVKNRPCLMTARMRERAASSIRVLMASESRDEPNSAKNILEKMVCGMIKPTHHSQ